MVGCCAWESPDDHKVTKPEDDAVRLPKSVVQRGREERPKRPSIPGGAAALRRREQQLRRGSSETEPSVETAPSVETEPSAETEPSVDTKSRAEPKNPRETP